MIKLQQKARDEVRKLGKSKGLKVNQSYKKDAQKLLKYKSVGKQKDENLDTGNSNRIKHIVIGGIDRMLPFGPLQALISDDVN